MHWLFQLHLLFYFFYTQTTSAELNVPDLLINERNLAKGATLARITQRGINYLTTVLGQALIPEILDAQIGQISSEIRMVNGSLAVKELSLAINSFTPTIRAELSPPKLVLVTISDFSLTSKLQVLGNVGATSLDNSVFVNFENIVVYLSIQPTHTSTGSPNLKLQNCKVEVVKAAEFLRDGLTDAQHTVVRSALQSQADALLNELLCNRMHVVMEDRVNNRINLLSSKMALKYISDDEITDYMYNQIRKKQENTILSLGVEANVTSRNQMAKLLRSKRQLVFNINEGISIPMGTSPDANVGLRRKKRDTLIAGFNVSRANNLSLDYTIVSDINVTKLGVEIESSGEISLHGQGGTPFRSVKIVLPQTVDEDSMLQMLISDFMINSFLYHGRTIGLFNTRVDSSTSHIGLIMRTSCSLSSGTFFCLGDLFPTLRRLHPNRKLALLFNPTQAPVIQFRPQTSGGTTFNLLGRIVFLVIEPSTRQEIQVAEMSIEVSAFIKFRLSSTMVRPKITLEKIKLATLSPGIVMQNEIEDAAVLSREILQRMANDILKNGIPIPVHPLFRLIKPKVKILERALLLQTKFKLNERLIKQIVTGDLRKRL